MNRALVVGCAAYEDPDIAPLRYADRDAARIAEVLRTVCGVEGDALTLLHDGLPDRRSHPTRTNVLRHLSRLSTDGGDGILFFYFSGHGFQAADTAHYLLPIDCVRGAIEETALRFDLIVRYLGSAAAPHVVLLLDACRNVVDGGKTATAGLASVDVSALCPPGVVTFCSCVPGTVSYEAEGLKAGVFSQALVEAFSDQGRCRTVYELDTYLSRRVPEIAVGEGKPRQVPHSRVEPLGVQQLEIVSERKRNEWRAATPIGAEQRSRRVPRTADGEPDPLIAIDFGTSYSVVSYFRRDGTVELLPGPDGRPLVPSVVHFLPGLDYLVGAAAVEADHYRPDATIRHVKRSLGTTANYEIDGRSIAPELAASLILRSLRRNAEEALGTPVRRCLAARPANFTRRQTAALERAFVLADLELHRLVGEPNIAAVLTSPDEGEPGFDEEQQFLVVDLGGGTFDVALVESGDGVAEIKSANGSSTVGGLDYDRAIVAFAERQLREQHGWQGELPSRVRAALRREAERAKRDLGRRESTTLLLQDLDYGDRGLQDVSIELDRDTFRSVTAELDGIIRGTLAATFDAGLWTVPADQWLADGGQVMLAGQGGKIFTVREQIEQLLPGVTVVSRFQETAVVHGLGRYTGVLKGWLSNVLLLDALGFGIGFRCRRGTSEGERLDNPSILAADPAANVDVFPLIEPATTIPTKRSEMVRLDGPPGTPHVLEFVELPEAGDEGFGHIEIRSEGTEVNLVADVDAYHLVVISVQDIASGQVSEYQLTNFDQRTTDAGPGAKLRLSAGHKRQQDR
ncbi:Hsp70 family protein [Jidongwangia harbinensis]|uniref:Hsp70 family protein n=1 Tax=Jidongwangia harbinensis TaxID=2878561 RepID=UPI001CDA0910|nr:Hsp70 family protein [Jidongwangia harbinensis]MCA2215450.1 Hsp70 family protein [Jidongwangia harbinensis]